MRQGEIHRNSATGRGAHHYAMIHPHRMHHGQHVIY
jgi:hypothetical protein